MDSFLFGVAGEGIGGVGAAFIFAMMEQDFVDCQDQK